jgi:AraC family transcriptional regulator of adaptative response / DNA-3-methyladenine glycosylase II
MKLQTDRRFNALLKRDRHLEGRYYLANKSVKVYCCRICGGKAPLAKNVEIFTHRAEAEAAGYRPCRLCRPELVPEHTDKEIKNQLSRSISFNINQGYLTNHSFKELAGKLHTTESQLHKFFTTEFGVAPQQFWQTHRLLLAKQLLTDSAIPLSEVAKASGFINVQELHAVLAEKYHLHPSDFRKRQRKDVAKSFGDFSFRLAYRPPLDWERLLKFLSRRAVPEVEAVEDGCYLRTVHIERSQQLFSGTVTVKNDPQHCWLMIQIAQGLLPVSAMILERMKYLFDLHADPVAIAQRLGTLGKARPGLRVPGSFDTFEMAVRAILGQQVSVAGARTLIGRFAVRFGTALATGQLLLTHLFPTPKRVSRASVDLIQSIGITNQRAKSILSLARAISKGNLLLEPGLPPQPAIEKLRSIPGIGEWTADYIAMRALAWPDAFLHTDVVIRRVLKEENSNKLLRRSEKWRPYRAYAVLQLWSEAGEA